MRAMTTLSENLERLEETIVAACRAAGRSRGEVELMAVSKTFPAETMVEAAGLGIRLFGENRVQEFDRKSAELHAEELWSGLPGPKSAPGAPNRLKVSQVPKSEPPGAPRHCMQRSFGRVQCPNGHGCI